MKYFFLYVFVWVWNSSRVIYFWQEPSGNHHHYGPKQQTHILWEKYCWKTFVSLSKILKFNWATNKIYIDQFFWKYIYASINCLQNSRLGITFTFKSSRLLHLFKSYDLPSSFILNAYKSGHFPISYLKEEEKCYLTLRPCPVSLTTI